jgi:hypothetical protein
MKHGKWVTFSGILLVVLIAIAGWFIQDSYAAGGSYKILAWNDLGMHCYSRDFADLAVLPPYNTLWVQVVKNGDPPELVTSGITVEYFYADNTYSVGKTNFWDYDQALFGVDLPPDVGLKGKGLSGTMDLAGDHFVAEGIPITEFSDSAPTVRQPYQLATVVVKDSTTGTVLTSTQVVTPTSSEMRCDKCHSDTGIARPSVPTGKVETNILRLHDEEAGTKLMNSRPVLCASCHASNALGAPGKPGLGNLSKVMHEQHAEVIPNTVDGCYNCHPGPQTRCLRDVMSTRAGMTCINCHGGMSNVSNNPNPWLNEPRCDTCHNSGQFNQDQTLYRFSKGHGGLYCESCHDSTHAIAPSREGNDAIKFIQLQGRDGPLQECSVCHTTTPTSGRPHSSNSPQVISILRADPSPTISSTVKFTVLFSENVTGVDKSDFIVKTTGLSAASIAAVSGSGSQYIVSANTGTSTGTIRVDVADNDSIKDSGNIPLGGQGINNGNFISGQAYTITEGVDVTIGKELLGTYAVLPASPLIATSPNTVDGPVRVKSMRGGNVFTSERVILGTSFNEVMGYPTNQLTTEYWFPWYDNISMDTWILVGNPTTTTAAVDVYVGGIKKSSHSIPAGGRVTPRFNLQTGPVRVVSTNGVKILSSERTLYKGAFNEVMGYAANQFTTEYWFPWYDNLSMDTWILVGNPSPTSTAAVDIYIGGVKKGTYTIAKGGQVTPRFNLQTGPVRVVSTNGVKIFSSERTLAGDSFNEVMGYPATQFTTEYWYPWYDNVGMDTWVLVGNPSTTSTATVDVYVGGIKRTTATIPAGGRITPRFNLNTGPVRVVSTNGVKIFTSQRVLYGTSFNEVMGYPGNKLTTEYWFPWYDSISMSTDILVGRP